MEADGISLLLFRAQTCESMECYEEMREVMKNLTKVKCTESRHLSDQERNLLSIAYRHCIGMRRSAWRMLCSAEDKLSKLSDAKSVIKLEIALDYKRCIESEIVEICAEMIYLLDSYLLTATNNDVMANELFYAKMKLDFYRYLSEVETGAKKDIATAAASKAFDTILEITFSNVEDDSLPLAHPTKLGMGLSYAVFYHDIYKNHKVALEFAERTFKMGLSGIEDASKDTYKDSVLILGLLRDNITTWKDELVHSTEDNVNYPH